jgi:hypothetical protein
LLGVRDACRLSNCRPLALQAGGLLAANLIFIRLWFRCSFSFAVPLFAVACSSVVCRFLLFLGFDHAGDA